MNNLRKSTVMLFIGVMVFSMLLIPFTPIASVDSQVSQALPETQDEFIQKWADRVENEMVGDKMDPILTSYMDTGVMDESMVTTSSGDVKLLLYVSPSFDIGSIASFAKVRWQIDLVVSRVASVQVSSITALRQLDAMEGINYIQADRYLDQIVDNEPVSGTDQFHINDVVGATSAIDDFGYDGTGIVVGIDDSGIDFSHPDLMGTEYINAGYPTSYDPSSFGLTAMTLANGSYVANTTAWLEEGYLLTYNGTDGNMYLDVSGWDPVFNYNGAGRNLISWLVTAHANAWGIHNGTEFVTSEMWQDIMIPDPAGTENYTFGFAFQQRSDASQSGYTRIVAPSMVHDGDLIIDWNGTLAWTKMWMEAWYFETTDLSVQADRDIYTDIMDWSFVDDIAAGYTHSAAKNILAADLDDDGSMDVGLGSLSWAYDDLGYLDEDYGVWFGITDDALAWNCLFTHSSFHGMWTGSVIASQGDYDYEVYDNTTTITTTTIVDGKTVITESTITSLYKLPGVAPGAKIIACKGISSGGGLMADFWAAGFHLNESAGPYLNESWWQYTTEGANHKADIVSNSWGWGPSGSWLQLYYYALVYDIASVPDVLKTGYPGTLFVFSAGNDGPDYGKSGTPSGSYSVISVGASYTSHYYETLYGPEQTDGQAVFFSSNGPGFTGIVKPDVMAPGYRGVNPQPFHSIWADFVGIYDDYYWWQGTSLSCPVAAGVTAIIMEAWAANHGAVKPTPQMTKDLLLSSATDMGYDPFIQGHGLVNAWAAVNAIENDLTSEYIFEASDSFDNYGAQVAEAWARYMSPATAGGFTGMEYPTSTPVGLESSSIFFGSVEPDEVVVAALDIVDYAGNDIGGATINDYYAWEYTEDMSFSFVLETDHYNDTNFIPKIVRPTSFNLFDEITTAGYWSEFNGAQYVTLSMAFDADDIGIYARLFDWSDDVLTGDLNYWNFKTGTGDIVDHIARDTTDCNLLTIRLADPLTMDHLFDYVPALQLDDAHAPTNVTVTVTIWEKTTPSEISIADTATGVDVTLTVPSSPEYGIHQGSIYFEDAGGWTHEVPYSYMVDFTMESLYGNNQTLVDGAGTLTPYETGAVTTSFIEGTTRYDESGGVRTFRLNIPYDINLNASVMVIRAEWQNTGTVVDFYMRTLLNSIRFTTDDGGGPFDSNPTSDLANTIIWDPGYLINGSYWFWYAVHNFDGADVPEDITITFQLYNATTLADATYVNGWYARGGTSTSFDDGETLAGDHVMINNTWNLPAVSGIPEYTITSSKIALLSGLHEVMTGTYPDPQGVDAWPVPLTSTAIYNWHTVEGITAGDNVRVSIDAQSAQDPAFDVWAWEDADSDGEVDLDELGSASLLSVDNGGSGTPEAGSYTAAESGDIALRVYAFDYAWVAGAHYVLDVDTRASVDIWSGSGTPAYAEFDTYRLLRNITMTVQYYCYTATDVWFGDELGTVSFANFFKPVVTVPVPVETATTDVFNITWSSTDQNADDVPYYSVWLSNDGGETYQLLAQNLTGTFFVWDSNGWLETSYIVRVRAYSLDFTNFSAVYGEDFEILPDVTDPPAGYWPGDYTDGFSAAFNAGDTEAPTPTTTTPPPTTTTTTTAPPPPGELDPLLVGLIGGIGVGVVVILILFLIKKK